jgi:hypothetical protein
MPEILAWYDDRRDDISNYASRRNDALLSTVEAKAEAGSQPPPHAPQPAEPEPTA